MSDRITIFGAGLVGSLLALFLARRGYKVDVFERRNDLRKNIGDSGLSVNLAISVRGFRSLAKLGLEERVREMTVAMPGRMMHSQNGDLTYQPYGKDQKESIHSLSRSGLNRLLLDEIDRTDGVSVSFDHRLESGDLDSGDYTLLDEANGQSKTINCPVVIGADGANSGLRKVFEAAGKTQTNREIMDYGYKELEITPSSGNSHAMEKNAFHIWPRGGFLLIALPNIDGSFTTTLFLAKEGKLSFDTINDEPKMMAFFEEYFPDTIPLIPNLKRDFFRNPTGAFGTIKCGPWSYGDRALLIGDASHAIIPFFGQGMNAGFEDVFVLDEILEDFGGQRAWGEVFSELFERRKVQSDAIADMAKENFVEMRDHVGDPRFLHRKKLERALQERFPEKFVTRYQLVSFSSVPYRTAQEAGLIQTEMLDQLLSNGLEQVDFGFAEKLIDERLVPFMRERKSEFSSYFGER